MSAEWVVVELSHQGEKKSPQELETLLSDILGGGVEVFVPALTFQRRDTQVVVYVLEGYVFISSGLSHDSYFDLEENANIKAVLAHEDNTGKYIRYVEHDVVDNLRRKLQDMVASTLKVGDEVNIIEGAYSALSGVIRDVLPGDTATVHITDLVSQEVIVELPFQFLEHKSTTEEFRKLKEDEEVTI